MDVKCASEGACLYRGVVEKQANNEIQRFPPWVGPQDAGSSPVCQASESGAEASRTEHAF